MAFPMLPLVFAQPASTGMFSGHLSASPSQSGMTAWIRVVMCDASHYSHDWESLEPGDLQVAKLSIYLQVHLTDMKIRRPSRPGDIRRGDSLGKMRRKSSGTVSSILLRIGLPSNPSLWRQVWDNGAGTCSSPTTLALWLCDRELYVVSNLSLSR